MSKENPLKEIESVYSFIYKQTGRVRLTDIIEGIGNESRVRYAISYLNKNRRIQRKKGFGKRGVEYFYYATPEALIK